MDFGEGGSGIGKDCRVSGVMIFVGFMVYELRNEWTRVYAPRRKQFLADGHVDDDDGEGGEDAAEAKEMTKKNENRRVRPGRAAGRTGAPEVL